MDSFQRIQWLNRECPDGGILQSEEWRNLASHEGLRTAHYEKGNLWMNVLRHQLPIVGSYWYAPRGPIIELSKQSASLGGAEAELWREMLQSLKKEGAGWIRIEPRDQESLRIIQEWSVPFRVRKSAHDVQPKENLVLDISENESELLSAMKPKTRYNISLAGRRGVDVSEEWGEEACNESVRLIQEMAERNRIAVHPAEHYRSIGKYIPREMHGFFVARRSGQSLASALVLFYGDTATYLHGGSSNANRDLMAPFLVQWEAIREAKRRGCRRYDFGGVDVMGDRPGLIGVSRFKCGFAPSVKPLMFPGTFDVVLSESKYFAYRMGVLSKRIAKIGKSALTKT